MNEMEECENSRLHATHPFIKPYPIVARYAAKQHGYKFGIRKEPNPNYWVPIIKRHAKHLRYLPVPPKNFVRQERTAKRSKSQKDQDGLNVSLKRLLLGDKKHELPSHRANECRRWVLQPMAEKPPEPMPGVPTVTVTDPGGKTWWPKDLNSYITPEQEAEISARVTEEHHGPDSEAHCGAFQEAYRKGLDNKPKGMRPEVLYCCACWTKQTKIEEEEVRIANEARIAEAQTTTKEREAVVKGA